MISGVSEGGDSPNLFPTSRQPRMASRMLARASARDSPWDTAPCTAGQITEYPPSSSGSRITVNFISESMITPRLGLSLPLNRTRRLRSDIVHDPVDRRNLVHDAVGHASQEVVGEMGPVRGHGVFGGDGADGDDVAVGAVVANNVQGAAVGEDGERLPEVAVHGGALHLVHHDPVAGAQRVQLLAGDLADDADGEAGSGEGLAEDDLFRQAEGETYLAHFVLEQIAQRLDELEGHLFWQAADVVVRLDGVGSGGDGVAGSRRLCTDVGLGCDGAGLDHIRIRRTLRDEVDASELIRLLLERANERLADDAALLFGVGDGGEPVQEAVSSVGMDEVHLH